MAISSVYLPRHEAGSNFPFFFQIARTSMESLLSFFFNLGLAQFPVRTGKSFVVLKHSIYESNTSDVKMHWQPEFTISQVSLSAFKLFSTVSFHDASAVRKPTSFYSNMALESQILSAENRYFMGNSHTVFPLHPTPEIGITVTNFSIYFDNDFPDNAPVQWN